MTPTTEAAYAQTAPKRDAEITGICLTSMSRDQMEAFRTGVLTLTVTPATDREIHLAIIAVRDAAAQAIGRDFSAVTASLEIYYGDLQWKVAARMKDGRYANGSGENADLAIGRMLANAQEGAKG